MNNKEKKKKQESLRAQIDKLENELEELDNTYTISDLDEQSSFTRPSGKGKTHSGDYQYLTRLPNCFNSEKSTSSKIKKLLKKCGCVLAFNGVSIIVLPEDLTVTKSNSKEAEVD